MPVSKQLPDDQRDEWSAKSQARLDDKAVGDQTATTQVRRQASLVAPPKVEPRAGLLDEAAALLDLVECEGVSVEGQHVQQQKPTPEDDSPRNDFGWQRLVIAPARHVNERMQFEVHALHRGDDSPNVVHVGVERRGELELDLTMHVTSMTAKVSSYQHTASALVSDSGDPSPVTSSAQRR